MLPRIVEGSPPTTRLRATELLLGCTKVTDSARPTLKLCQLIAAFWLDWWIVRASGALVMLALPAETTPPAGMAWAVEASVR